MPAPNPSRRPRRRQLAINVPAVSRIAIAILTARSDGSGIGTVCNLAARLCAEAQDGQILVAQRVAVAVEETITLEEVGALTLKGLTQPVWPTICRSRPPNPLSVLSRGARRACKCGR